MRRKVFIASKSVKIAIAIVAASAIMAGMLGVFYSKNKTLEYANHYKENKALVNRVGAFLDASDYRAAISGPSLVAKRTRLFQIHAIAQDLDLLGAGEINAKKLGDFLESVKNPSSTNLPTSSPSDPMFVDITNDLKLMIDRMIYFSESLSSSSATEFDLKLDLLASLGKIAYTLDCQGTLASNIARCDASKKILEQIYQFRKSSATEDQKNALIAACLPEINKPYDIPLMLKSEHLRVQESIDILENQSNAAVRTFESEHIAPMSTVMKVEANIPGVQQAWKSRLNYEFWHVINDATNPPQKGLKDFEIIGRAFQRIKVTRSSAEYLDYFGLDFAKQTDLFGRKEWLIYHLSRPQVPERREIERKL